MKKPYTIRENSENLLVLEFPVSANREYELGERIFATFLKACFANPKTADYEYVGHSVQFADHSEYPSYAARVWKFYFRKKEPSSNSK